MSCATEVNIKNELKWLVAAPPSEFNFKGECCCVIMVDAGQSVGHINAETAASAGLKFMNIDHMPDGTLVSKATGRLNIQDKLVWVDSLSNTGGRIEFTGDLTIHGNLADSCKIKGGASITVHGAAHTGGCLESKGPLTIHGNLLHPFKAASGQSIVVHGLVQGAEVRAAGELHIDGGIEGSNKGHCFAGGALKTQFISSATVESLGDIIVEQDITSSQVTCSGKLVAEGGRILASRVIAGCGIHCRNLGSEARVSTTIEAGFDDNVRKIIRVELSVIRQIRNRAAQIKKTIEPLMKQQKRLNVAQKEKATELLYEAGELEAQACEKFKALQQTIETSRQRCVGEIAVLGMLHAGTIIRLAGLETEMEDRVRGPLKVIAQHSKRQIELINIADAASRFIDAKVRKDPDLEAVAQMAKEAA